MAVNTAFNVRKSALLGAALTLSALPLVAQARPDDEGQDRRHGSEARSAPAQPAPAPAPLPQQNWGNRGAQPAPQGNWAPRPQPQAAPQAAPAWSAPGNGQGRPQGNWSNRPAPQANAAPPAAPLPQPSPHAWGRNAGQPGAGQQGGGQQRRDGQQGYDGQRGEARAAPGWRPDRNDGGYRGPGGPAHYDGRHDNARAWDHRWRRDNRYDWQGWRDDHRDAFHVGRYYPPYRDFYYRRLSVGFVLDSLFWGDNYWINDPFYYHLPPAYGPYRWVRYYDDAMLVDTYSGQVVDVIYGFFW